MPQNKYVSTLLLRFKQIYVFLISIMKKLSEIIISRFDSIKSSQPNAITLFEELGNIKRGKYKESILKCREAISREDKVQYNELKIQLPAVTFCGEFLAGRKASNITQYNNLMILDIDNLGNDTLKDTINKLQKDIYLLALWLSPSGKGLKGLVKIESDIHKHKYVFNALRVYFLNNYQIELDKSGSDVSRLCLSSWDENLFFNEKSNVFEDFLELEENISGKEQKIKSILSLNKNAYSTEGLNKVNDTKIIRAIIKFLNKHNFSITETYDSWVKVALAISCTFSYDVGEKYFLQICILDRDRHSEGKSIELLKYCYNKRQFWTNNHISLGTIVFYAKNKGFLVRKK